MKNPYLLHIFNSVKNVSPFDVNMAYEAEFDGVIPYSGVTLEDVYNLTQDTIFSRGTAGVKRTGIFIGGRDFGLAIDMLNRAKSAMFGPFEVSLFADPSGAITTASTLVASIQLCLEKKYSRSLEGLRVSIIGGTGPVGTCAGVLAAQLGAKVILISHRGVQASQRCATEYNQRFQVDMQGGDGSTKEKLTDLAENADVIIGAAKAGLRVLTSSQLKKAKSLLIAADINAVPPSGIEGVESDFFGEELKNTPKGAIGLGALAIGNIKYKVHYHMFNTMKNSARPVFFSHKEAFESALDFVKEMELKD